MYFSDIFNVDQKVLDEYGYLNISLVNDLPLFIDPFLLFNSKKEEYINLHKEIIKYVIFLRDEALANRIDKGLIKRWFYFSEVKQNWLGFCLTGNTGSGLGQDFADSLYSNFSTVLKNFGEETISKSHIEKLCLFKDGIGRDNISDFTTNLIKGFLLEYTENFAKKFLSSDKCKQVMIDKVFFNYTTKSWVQKSFYLPYFNGDYILLTPLDILTKDDTWISKNSLFNTYDTVVRSIENVELRSQLNDYFRRILPKAHKSKDVYSAKSSVLSKFPEVIDYYIRYMERNGGKAEKISEKKVAETYQKFVAELGDFSSLLKENTPFYETSIDSYEATLNRVLYLKQVIEKNDGYKLFYNKNEVVGNEKDLHILFRLAWFSTGFSVDSEVNNGRGPVDYKVSKGFSDSTVVEFKLARNSKLKQNIKKQLEIYQEANNTKKGIKVILFYTHEEELKVKQLLKELKIDDKENIVLIDARNDNKKSASIVK
jgi:hypothetical protein